MDNALAHNIYHNKYARILRQDCNKRYDKGWLSKYVSSVDNGKNASISKLGFEPKNFILGGKTNFRFAKLTFHLVTCMTLINTTPPK